MPPLSASPPAPVACTCTDPARHADGYVGPPCSHCARPQCAELFVHILEFGYCSDCHPLFVHPCRICGHPWRAVHSELVPRLGWCCAHCLIDAGYYSGPGWKHTGYAPGQLAVRHPLHGMIPLDPA